MGYPGVLQDHPDAGGVHQQVLVGFVPLLDVVVQGQAAGLVDLQFVDVGLGGGEGRECGVDYFVGCWLQDEGPEREGYSAAVASCTTISVSVGVGVGCRCTISISINSRSVISRDDNLRQVPQIDFDDGLGEGWKLEHQQRATELGDELLSGTDSHHARLVDWVYYQGAAPLEKYRN